MDLLLPGIESFRSPEIENALELLAKSGETERGAIFTRKIVVDAILDLSGYFPSGNLSNERILEPSFGGGDFLLPPNNPRCMLRALLEWPSQEGR